MWGGATSPPFISVKEAELESAHWGLGLISTVYFIPIQPK